MKNFIKSSRGRTQGWAFVRMDPLNVSAKFAVFIALAVPEIIAIAVLGWGCEPTILGEGEAVEGQG